MTESIDFTMVADGSVTIAELEGLTANEAYQLAEFGWMMLGTGQTRIATTVFEMLTLSNPHHAYFFALLGLGYDRGGDRRSALEAYARAIELDGNETAALVNRAELLLASESAPEREEAAMLLERALAVDGARDRLEVRRAKVLLDCVRARRVEVPGITEVAGVI